jgi:hypothetical protein
VNRDDAIQECVTTLARKGYGSPMLRRQVEAVIYFLETRGVIDITDWDSVRTSVQSKS